MTEFVFGVVYSSKGALCPSVALIYVGLIGSGVAEAVLLFAFMFSLWYKYTNSGNEVKTVSSVTTYSGGYTAREGICCYTDRCCSYGLTVIAFGASAVFFFMLHGVFSAQGTTQFTNSNAGTFCEPQLFKAAFGLTIASYLVGIVLFIFGIVLYKTRND